MKIGVFTIGDVKLAFRDRLVCELEERFLYPFKSQATLSLSSSAFNVVKKQYFAPALLNRMKEALSPEIKYALGIAGVDLYGISLNYIFGDASPEDRVGLVSLHRLRPEFYGHAPEEWVLFERVLKESMHQVAHLFSAKHCYDPNCVMHYSNSIYDMDKKRSLFCPECEQRLAKAAIYDRLKE